MCWSSSWSDSTCSVSVAGSQTTWLIPVTAPSGSRTRKTLSLVAVAGSISPENGIEMRGWGLKPSRSFRTSMSSQSEGRVAQFDFGRSTLTARQLRFRSGVVKRSVGNGPPEGVVMSQQRLYDAGRLRRCRQ